jgi:hypothetical protein
MVGQTARERPVCFLQSVIAGTLQASMGDAPGRFALLRRRDFHPFKASQRDMLNTSEIAAY